MYRLIKSMSFLFDFVFSLTGSMHVFVLWQLTRLKRGRKGW